MHNIKVPKLVTLSHRFFRSAQCTSYGGQVPSKNCAQKARRTDSAKNNKKAQQIMMEQVPAEIQWTVIVVGGKVGSVSAARTKWDDQSVCPLIVRGCRARAGGEGVIAAHLMFVTVGTVVADAATASVNVVVVVFFAAVGVLK